MHAISIEKGRNKASVASCCCVGSSGCFALCMPLLLDAVVSCEAADVTMQDVLDGIEARQTKVRDMDVSYTILDELTNAYYARERRRAELAKRYNQGLAAEKKIREKFPEAARKKEDAYHLIVKGDMIAFEIFTIQNAKTSLVQRGAFRDGALRTLSDLGRGLIQQTRCQTLFLSRQYLKNSESTSFQLKAICGTRK